MSKRDNRPSPRHLTVTTAGPPPVLSEPIRTASGREVHSGDTVTPDDPIVLPALHDTSSTLTIGVATITGTDAHGRQTSEAAEVKPVAWWNNIRRAWFIGPADAPVLVSPQPPAPQVHEWNSVTIGGRTLPPAVKVSA